MVAALLQYHVVNGTIQAANITSSPEFVDTLLMNQTYTTVSSGQVLEAQTMGGDVIITSGYKNQATVIQADLNYTGGYVNMGRSPVAVSWSCNGLHLLLPSPFNECLCAY